MNLSCALRGTGPGTGRGLSGLRERVVAESGRLTWHAVEGGGFEVLAWLPIFQAREADRAPVGFWDLPIFIRDLFSAPPEVLLPRLMALYHADIPDVIVLLTLDGQALAARMALKKGAAPQELHEQAHILAMFQGGLTQSCEALAKVRPGTIVKVIDASKQSPSETEAAVLAAIGLRDDQAL